MVPQISVNSCLSVGAGYSGSYGAKLSKVHDIIEFLKILVKASLDIVMMSCWKICASACVVQASPQLLKS